MPDDYILQWGSPALYEKARTLHRAEPRERRRAIAALLAARTAARAEAA